MFDRRLESGRRLVDEFLEEAPLRPGERAFLDGMRPSSMRLYEVTEVVPGSSIKLRDLIDGGVVAVRERTASRSVARHDCLAARVIARGCSGMPEIERGVLSLPQHLKEPLVRAAKEHVDEFLREHPEGSMDEACEALPPLVHEAWLSSIFDPAVPELANTDGEKMILTRSSFLAEDPEAVRRVLEGAQPEGIERTNDDRWLWVGANAAGKDVSLGTIVLRGETLTVEVNSVERGVRARELIDRLAGGILRHRATTHEDLRRQVVEKVKAKILRGEGGEEESGESAVDPDTAEALISQHLSEHYRRWVDEPVPLLDGRTPRQAVRSAAPLDRALLERTRSGGGHRKGIPPEGTLKALPMPAVRAGLAAAIVASLVCAPACREAPQAVRVASPARGVVPASAGAQGPEPSWWQDAIGYEVFVRSFRDSNGDGIGDLRGLIERLDYLNDGDDSTHDDLGVDLLWLMPINEGPSYHGYAVSDYRAIESDYGSLADFDALIAAAKARGIRVVLDLVVNHSSDEHPWFREAASSRDAPHRQFYRWRDQDPGWTPPWGDGKTWHRRGDAYYYGLFSETMPDLNLEEPKVRAEIFDVARFWLARGAAGFRLDAARYLIETEGGPKGQADTEATHRFWRELRTVVKAARRDAILIGEVWAPTPVVVPYFGSEGQRELDMGFDFDAAGGIIHAIRRGDAEPARLALAARLAAYPAFARAGTFLANHDQFRLATVLDHRGVPAGKLAAALLLTFPGTPWLYYGEELGLVNGADGGDDRLKRRPHQWTGGPGVGFTTSSTPWMPPANADETSSVRGQTRDPNSLLSTYRRLIRARRASPALQRGATRILTASGSASEPLVLGRTEGRDEKLLVFNFSAEVNDVEIPADEVPSSANYRDLFGRGMMSRSAREPLRVRGLEGYGYRIFDREPVSAR